MFKSVIPYTFLGVVAGILIGTLGPEAFHEHGALKLFFLMGVGLALLVVCIEADNKNENKYVSLRQENMSLYLVLDKFFAEELSRQPVGTDATLNRLEQQFKNKPSLDR